MNDLKIFGQFWPEYQNRDKGCPFLPTLRLLWSKVIHHRGTFLGGMILNLDPYFITDSQIELHK